MLVGHAPGYGNRVVARQAGDASEPDLNVVDVGERAGDHVSIVVATSDSAPEIDPTAYDLLLTRVAHPPAPWVHCAIPDTLGRLSNAVRASSAAAQVLVHVLRVNEGLPVEHALTVESLAYSALQHGGVFRAWLQGHEPSRGREHEEDPVRIERSGARLDVVLRRSEVHNALNAAMRDRLCDAFDLVALDASISEVHLRGEGPSFSSGGDLEEFGLARDATAAHLLRTDRSVGRRIHHVSGRVTAHLHGACIGAGIELAAFAGRVVADRSTFVQLPEVAMGLIPGAGGTVSLTRRAGRHRVAFLALMGARLDVETALEWGIVDQIV
jgi:hypothetical protein